MFYDVHMHYLQVSDMVKLLDDFDANTPGLPSWWTAVLPEMPVALEFGPKGGNNDVFTTWNTTFRLDVLKMTGQGGNGNFWDTWDLMIKDNAQNSNGWELKQFGLDGFQMFNVLTSIRDHNFTAVCYGPSVQGPDSKPKFSIATLKAGQVDTSRVCDPSTFLTPMLHHTCITGNPLDDGDDGFEEIIVGNFVIPYFTVNRSSNCQ